MSQQFATFETYGPEWSPVRWAFHVWSWIALVALFIVLEVFVDPLTASLVLCLKLGWRDLLAAARLRGHPDARIAHSLGWYCLAQACYKVALAGVAVAWIVVACEAALGVPPRPERFIAGLALLFTGVMLGQLLTVFAAVRSGEWGLRGWLDGTLYENLFRGRARLTCHGTVNRVRWLLRLAMVLISLSLLPAPITMMVVLLAKGNPAGIPGALMFTLFWLWSYRPLRTALSQAARAPEECWGPA
jgi:hypothetical protein